MGAQVEATVTVKTPIVLCAARRCIYNCEGLCVLSIISIDGGYSPECKMYERRQDEKEE